MKPAGRRLTTKAVRKMLEDLDHRLDPEMSKELMCKVYRLHDGSAVLIFEDGRGVLYESHKDMVAKYWSDVERAKRGSNSLGELLPQGEAFLGGLLSSSVNCLPA